MKRPWLLLLFGIPLMAACHAPEEPERLVDDWQLAGHGELALEGETLVPVVTDGHESLRACVDPGREVDTSQWEGVLEFVPLPSPDGRSDRPEMPYQPPERRGC